jgi:hypothetical protein
MDCRSGRIRYFTAAGLEQNGTARRAPLAVAQNLDPFFLNPELRLLPSSIFLLRIIFSLLALFLIYSEETGFTLLSGA